MVEPSETTQTPNHNQPFSNTLTQLSAKLPIKNSPFYQPLIQIFSFLGIFISLQTLYGLTGGTWFERLVIDDMTVKTTAILIGWISPEVGIQSSGTHLSAFGGGINIADGCTGLEVMFMLMSAIVIAPLNRRGKLWGLLLGIPYIFMLNQLRLIALFYSFRLNKPLFLTLHSTVAPILLTALTVLFFAYWLSLHQQYADSSQTMQVTQ